MGRKDYKEAFVVKAAVFILRTYGDVSHQKLMILKGERRGHILLHKQQYGEQRNRY